MNEKFYDVKKNISIHIEKGEFIEAKKLVNEITNENDEILSIKSVIAYMESKYEESMKYIQKGLKLNIANYELYYNMAKVLEAKGEEERALICYEQAMYYCNNDDIKTIIMNDINYLEKSVKVSGTSIIILTYNNLEYTKMCIQSIRDFVDMENNEIIVVDNNSQDGTQEWLKEQKDLKCIVNKENKGFPGGCNQGILLANKENDIFLLNNDTILMVNSLFNLKMGLYKNKYIGAVGAISNSVSYYQQINIGNDKYEDYCNFALKNNIVNDDLYEERMKLIGFAMLIKREAIDKVGLLDERFAPGNFEDDDYSLRIIQEGYRLLLCKDSFIYHFGSTSFKENKLFNNILIENSKKFKEKWGFSSEYSFGIRFDIINKIKVDEDKSINVLEIGCAGGATLLKIKDIYKNANVYGVDINKDVTKVSSKILNTQVLNIEKEKLNFSEKFFDFIILPDVLEHLVDPWETLKNIKKYLKDDGEIIASIPNVMHISVIDDLLRGQWNYVDAGILDVTHLRFFTLDSIKRMFGYAGFEYIYINSNIIHISNEQEERISKLVSLYGSNEMEYKTYQYIISAKSNNIKEEVLEVEIIKESKENKYISFIACVNDKEEFKSCRESILKINIPKGYGVEIIKIFNACSMSSGYNKAMNLAKGKYKVYLHQDIKILNTNIINEALEIFNNKEIGIIGIVGSEDIPQSGIWWESLSLFGNIIERGNNSSSLNKIGEVIDKYKKVKAVDGCLMITQYDIEWDEENFDGWHFYDVSQCFRFLNKGKYVVIPKQDNIWVFHDCGEVSMDGFDYYRKKFIEIYMNDKLNIE